MIDPGRNSGTEPACAETILRLFWSEKFGADPLNHFDSNYQPAQFQVWRAICYLQFVIVIAPKVRRHQLLKRAGGL